MGIATGGHDVKDLQEEVVGLFGQHEAEKGTALGGGVVAQVFPKQLDFAADGLDAGRKCLEQRRLPRAVGTRQSHDVAFVEAYVDFGHQGLTFVANQQVRGMEHFVHFCTF